MEQRIANVMCDLELAVARLVDTYVAVVTEGLCAMEHENPRIMEQAGFVERKALILKGLDALDGLVAGLREDGEHP